MTSQLGSKNDEPIAAGVATSYAVTTLLCYYCQRNQKLRVLAGEKEHGNRVIVVNNTVYGVCDDHERNYRALCEQP